jgi:hypothetical protein
MEKWNKIKDFPDYEVSNLGNVKSNKRNRTMILSARKCNGGYCLVAIWKDNKRYDRLIHRLVAEAFIDNTDNKPEIDHIDRNPLNNKVENLRYVTRSENCCNTSKITNAKYISYHKGHKKYVLNTPSPNRYTIGEYDSYVEALNERKKHLGF